MKQSSLPILLLATGLLAQASPPRGKAPTPDKAVAEKAWRLVSEVHGSWTEMPGNIAIRLMTSGPLLGNGNLGVALGRTADRQQFYLGRNDFWSVQRGKIMPVGQLQLDVPALRDATTELRENPAPGDVKARFAAAHAQMNTHAWVDVEKTSSSWS